MTKPTRSEPRSVSAGLARLYTGRAGVLGWPHVILGHKPDRLLARFVVGVSGLILGASTGSFIGGALGVILAMVLLPLLPGIAVETFMVTTLTCTGRGGGGRETVLQRETFHNLPDPPAPGRGPLVSLAQVRHEAKPVAPAWAHRPKLRA